MKQNIDGNLSHSHKTIQQLQNQVRELREHIERLCESDANANALIAPANGILSELYQLETELFPERPNWIKTDSSHGSSALSARSLRNAYEWTQPDANKTLGDPAPAPEILIRMSGSGIYLDFCSARNFIPLANSESVCGSSIYDHLPMELAEQYLEHIDRALTTREPQVFEFQIERHQVLADEEVYIVPIQTDEVLIVVRDVSHRKWVERQLLKSEATNRALLEMVPDLLIRLSRTGTYLDFKPSKNSKVLHSPETAIGKTVYELLPFELAVETMACVEQALETDSKQSCEFGLEIDGELRYQEAQIVALGLDEVLIIVRDISDRKQSEIALHQANERYRLATAAVNSTIYDWDVPRNYIDRSQGVGTQLGFAPEECDTTGEWWISRIHPDDHAVACETIATALKTASRYDLEYRIRNRQDQYIYVHDQALILRDSNGHPVRVVGNTVDVTARKQAEAALLKSEATNRALLEAIPDLIIRMTKTGTYLDYRYPPGFQAVFSPAKAVGKTPAQALPPDIAQTRMELAQAALETGEVQFQEFQLVVNDVLCHEEARIIAINDDEVLVIVRDISDRKAVEAALRQSEANLLALIENTEDLIWSVDVNYRLITLNSAFSRCFQYTYQQCLEAGCDILSYLSPDHRKYWQALYDRALAGEHFSTEYQSGSPSSGRYLEVSFNPIYQEQTQAVVGVSVFSRDITIHKQAQNILETAKHDLEIKVQERTAELSRTIAQLSQEIQERQRIETELKLRDRAVSASNNGIVICDARLPDNPVIYVNPAFQEMTGYSQSEIMGHNCRLLQGSQRLQPDLDVLRAALKAGKPCTVTLQNYRKDGTLFWNELSIAPIYDADNTLTHYVGIQTDITELKQSEFEIHKALVKERELGELKSRFISMTSHEFRTPLTVILSSASLLENYGYKWNDEKKMTHFQRIQIAGRRMTQLLEDILVLSKAEADKLQYQPKHINVLEFCHALVADLQLSDNDQHQIQFSCIQEIPIVCVDEKLLQQILNNLLSNALKYSPNGSSIDFTLSCEQNWVTFRIQDQGIGIPAKDLPHIFESFHRGHNVGTISGTGLGLTIVKKCVDLQGGTISVTSQEDTGTLFVVKLPALQANPNHDENISN